MKTVTAFVLALGMVISAHAEIYRWVDDAGNVHYSDRPEPGEERIEVIEVTKGSYYTPVELPPLKPPTVKTGEQAVYESVEILEPVGDGTVRDNQGMVQISIRSEPPLKQKHFYQLYLDGKAVYDPFTYTVVKIPNVDRGTHSIQVGIVDGEGAQLASSQSVTFHLHRAARTIKPEPRPRLPSRQP